MAGPSWIGRRRTALLEAAGLLEDQGVDQTQPIDVFGLIERLDIWLTFVPLGTTLGACLPVGRGGIMITTRRQPSVQRYTAAHEIGHWILDQGHPWIDDEEAILRPTAPERERIAQLFAAYLVMPPILVDATAGHHGIRPGRRPTPPLAYLVARDMGVSYEAAVRQMAELGIITRQDRDQLLLVSPLAAKKALAHGARPLVGNADVWPIDERWNGTHLDVTTADEIVIALPENRTTGYRWMTPGDVIARDRRQRLPAPGPFADGRRDPITQGRPDESVDERVEPDDRRPGDQLGLAEPLEVVTDQFAAAGPQQSTREIVAQRQAVRSPREPESPAPRIGAAGRRWLSVQAKAEGTWRYELAYAPAHEPNAPAVATFLVEATVHPTPSVAHARALLASAAFEDAPTVDPSSP